MKSTLQSQQDFICMVIDIYFIIELETEQL